MRLRWASLLIGGLLVAAGCSDSRTPTQPGNPDFALQQSNHHIMLPRGLAPALTNEAKPGGGGHGGGGTGIFYHGGPVLVTTNVAAIYWAGSTIYTGGPAPGSRGTGAQDGSLVGYFLRSLGGSGYFNINSTYFNGSGTHVQNSVTYTQFWAANNNVPAPGASVSDAAVQAEVISGFSSGNLTFDSNTLYEVFSGPGVNLGGGFGSSYCAYHGHFSWNGNDVKYSVMPHDYDFPSACAALSGSPNNDFAADAEVNTLAHETEETTTDEDLNAWYDRRGNENADKCAWTFGTTYTTSNGAVANENIGGKDWLIQRKWVNAGSGGCLQTYP
ncbi:MAG TPA: hypothetical protein VFK78_09045 [Gemmatimonadales bacterium]|nr:hypothetical protein [Gemmatimonadales bacterium]